MKSNRNGFVPVILAIVVALIILGGGYVIYKSRTNQQVSSPITNNSVASNKVGTSSWKTYRNKQHGFEFKYPVDWGDVVIKPGNHIPEEGRVACGMASYDVQESIQLYDNDLTFSKSPIAGDFYILAFSHDKPILSLCNEANNRQEVNLTEDKKKLENLPLGIQQAANWTTGTFVNQSGIKVFYYPDWSEGAGSDISQFYKFYGNGLEVEGGMAYAPYSGTPEEKELKKYTGIREWVKNGQTAGKIRIAFETFDKIIQTFKFTPSTSLGTGTPSSTIDTSSWKTYTNSQYGFSFKYPGDWELLVQDSSGFYVKGSSPLSGQEIRIAYVPFKLQQKSLQDYFSYVDTQGPLSQYPVTIHNVNWIERNEYYNGKGIYALVLYTVRAGYVHQISIQLFGNSTEKEEDPFFQQILSTFKFTTPSSSAHPSCPCWDGVNNVCLPVTACE